MDMAPWFARYAAPVAKLRRRTLDRRSARGRWSHDGDLRGAPATLRAPRRLVERPCLLAGDLRLTRLVPGRVPVLPVDDPDLRVRPAERIEPAQHHLPDRGPVDRPRHLGRRVLREPAAGLELPRNRESSGNVGPARPRSASPAGQGRLRPQSGSAAPAFRYAWHPAGVAEWQTQRT